MSLPARANWRSRARVTSVAHRGGLAARRRLRDVVEAHARHLDRAGRSGRAAVRRSGRRSARAATACTCSGRCRRRDSRTGTDSSRRRAGTPRGTRSARARARSCATPLSSGSRSASSASRPNSGSSSRNSTPRCASEISPGRGRLPPPTSAARRRRVMRRAKRRPLRRVRRRSARPRPTRCSRRAALVLARSGGSRPRSRSASMLLPLPGGPDHQQIVLARRGDVERALRERLAAHVGEIERWRFVGGAGSRRLDARAAARRRRDAARPHLDGPRRRPPRRVRAPPPRAFAAGSTTARPSRRAASTDGSAPVIGRSSPFSASSPRNSSRSVAHGAARVRAQHAERDRKVEAAALLRHVGRSQDAP